MASALLALTGCSQTPNEATTSAPAPAAAPAGGSIGSVQSLTKADLEAINETAGHCALDEVNNTVLSDNSPTITVKAAQDLTASGWIVSNSLQTPPKFTLVLSSAEGSTAYGMDGMTGIARPDVARALNADAAGSSGFNLTGNLGSMPAGTYKVMILIKGANGNEICDTTRQITVGS